MDLFARIWMSQVTEGGNSIAPGKEEGGQKLDDCNHYRCGYSQTVVQIWQARGVPALAMLTAVRLLQCRKLMAAHTACHKMLERCMQIFFHQFECKTTHL